MDLLVGIGREPHVPVCQDANQLASSLTACSAVLNDRNAGNAIPFHQVKSVLQGRVRPNDQRIDHHPGFELLDHPDLFGLLVERKVAVNDANATSLSHGDCQTAFGNCVHCRRDDRNIEFKFPCDPGAQVNFTRHDFRVARDQQDIVKRQGLLSSGRDIEGCHCQFPFVKNS